MRFFLILLIVCCVVSCSQRDPRSHDLVPAAGVVLHNGQPVAEASITFHREDGDGSLAGGSALSGSNGAFSINMFGKGDGTLPGTYRVTVVKETVESPVSPEELVRLEREDKPIPPSKVVSHLGAKYRNTETTDIIVTVPPKGTKDLRIELNDNP